MKLFHIGDVLSIMTERLVSPDGISGLYNILNFLTGDNLFTHYLGRANRECKPWLGTQYPQLFPNEPRMDCLLHKLTDWLSGSIDTEHEKLINEWLRLVQEEFKLPEMLPVYQLGADMHLHIDPIEELEAMVGKHKMLIVEI